MLYKRLITIDPSLTCSGWALFRIQDGKLLGVGKYKAPSAEYPLASRLEFLQNSIEANFAAIKLCANDVLICEEATSMLDPSAASKLERVRGIFETLARSKKVLVPGRIHPRTVQYELLGLRGSQLSRTIVKNVALETAIKLYANELEKLGFDISVRNLRRNQDIVDALLLGAVALTRLKSAKQAKMHLIDMLENSRMKSSSRKHINIS